MPAGRNVKRGARCACDWVGDAELQPPADTAARCCFGGVIVPTSEVGVEGGCGDPPFVDVSCRRVPSIGTLVSVDLLSLVTNAPFSTLDFLNCPSVLTCKEGGRGNNLPAPGGLSVGLLLPMAIAKAVRSKLGSEADSGCAVLSFVGGSGGGSSGGVSISKASVARTILAEEEEVLVEVREDDEDVNIAPSAVKFCVGSEIRACFAF